MIDATPLLRAAAGRRLGILDRMDPARAQLATLRRLLRRAADTRFGRDHEFASIATVGDYQRAVELRSYEAFWREYWSPSFPLLRDVTWPGLVHAFALSSGTTAGRSKHIPVTAAMMRADEGAAFDTMAFHLRATPRSRLLGGRSLMLGGSTGLKRLAPGVRAGDLSGIAASRVPIWARPFSFPPPKLARIGDWQRKMEALAPASLRADIRSVAGTPSWMLLFFEQLAALRPGRPRRLPEFYPQLELVVHGGVGFAPYRETMAAWLDGSAATTREVYAASEGFVAVADRGPDDGLRLVLDRGLFFEFVPVEQLGQDRPERHWLGTAELGRDYALVLSSNAGLWAYVLGDTVRFLGMDPPRIVVTGRVAQTLSAFGEHLIVAELDQAVTAAAQAVGRAVVEYAAGPVFPTAAEPRGRHVFVVELSPPLSDPAAAQRFASALDARLAALNADYRDHRAGDVGMLGPLIEAAGPGAFAAWMSSRGKLGGQNKVPRVINDPALLASLRRVISRPSPA